MLHQAIPYKPEDRVGPHAPTYNFIKNLSVLSARLRARSITVCWDGGVPASRYTNCPTYKQSRKATKTGSERARYEDFGRNKEMLLRILPFLKIASVQVDGLEADDLIFGFVHADPGRLAIVSGDMDLSQLVSERCEFHRHNKTTITASNFRDVVLDNAYDIRPRTGRDVILFKAMRGDSSDSIPPCVKPKPTAAIWQRMLADNAAPTLAYVREEAAKLGVVITNSLERNYDTVDLARSGVGGVAIGHALSWLNFPKQVNESEVYRMLLEVGIQPGYIHTLLPSFHYLNP